MWPKTRALERTIVYFSCFEKKILKLNEKKTLNVFTQTLTDSCVILLMKICTLDKRELSNNNIKLKTKQIVLKNLKKEFSFNEKNLLTMKNIQPFGRNTTLNGKVFEKTVVLKKMITSR